MNFRPLHILVHIPKTAGSTINHIMENSGLNSWPHIEGLKHNDEVLNQISNNADFISAHIPFREFRSIISKYTSRKVIFHSFIREPTMQVASYYNWLIEIFHRGGDFYEQHPQEIKEMSLKLRRSKNESSQEIKNNLNEFGDFFLNLQTYYLLEKRSFTSLREEINGIDHIWLTNQIDDFCNKVLGSSQIIPHANKSSYHFRQQIFFEDKLQEFLNVHCSSDYELYTFFSEKIKQAL